MGTKGKLIITAGILILLGLLFVIGLGKRGAVDLYQLKLERDRLQRANLELQKKNQERYRRVERLKNDFDFENLILLIGILSDKDIKAILSMIIPLSNVIVVTKSNNTRACDPAILKKMIGDLGNSKEVIVKDNIGDAVKIAKSITKKNDLVCVTGSLFTVGEARDYLL